MLNNPATRVQASFSSLTAKLKANIAAGKLIDSRHAKALAALVAAEEVRPFKTQGAASKSAGHALLDELKQAVGDKLEPIVTTRKGSDGGHITGKESSQHAGPCELVRYDEQEKCPNKTLHHVVPDHVFRAPNKQGQKGAYYKSDNDIIKVPQRHQGLCICVQGAYKHSSKDDESISRKALGHDRFLSNLGEHGLIHYAVDTVEAWLGTIGKPQGTTTLGQMEDAGAWAAGLVTGCDANDLKKQLREHHKKEHGLDPDIRVRADPSGRRFEAPKFDLMGKPDKANGHKR